MRFNRVLLLLLIGVLGFISYKLLIRSVVFEGDVKAYLVNITPINITYKVPFDCIQDQWGGYSCTGPNVFLYTADNRSVILSSGFWDIIQDYHFYVFKQEGKLIRKYWDGYIHLNKSDIFEYGANYIESIKDPYIYIVLTHFDNGYIENEDNYKVIKMFKINRLTNTYKYTDIVLNLVKGDFQEVFALPLPNKGFVIYELVGYYENNGSNYKLYVKYISPNFIINNNYANNTIKYNVSSFSSISISGPFKLTASNFNYVSIDIINNSTFLLLRNKDYLANDEKIFIYLIKLNIINNTLVLGPVYNLTGYVSLLDEYNHAYANETIKKYANVTLYYTHLVIGNTTQEFMIHSCDIFGNVISCMISYNNGNLNVINDMVINDKGGIVKVINKSFYGLPDLDIHGASIDNDYFYIINMGIEIPHNSYILFIAEYNNKTVSKLIKVPYPSSGTFSIFEKGPYVYIITGGSIPSLRASASYVIIYNKKDEYYKIVYINLYNYISRDSNVIFNNFFDNYTFNYIYYNLGRGIDVIHYYIDNKTTVPLEGANYLILLYGYRYGYYIGSSYLINKLKENLSSLLDGYIISVGEDPRSNNLTITFNKISLKEISYVYDGVLSINYEFNKTSKVLKIIPYTSMNTYLDKVIVNIFKVNNNNTTLIDSLCFYKYPVDANISIDFSNYSLGTYIVSTCVYSYNKTLCSYYNVTITERGVSTSPTEYKTSPTISEYYTSPTTTTTNESINITTNYTPINYTYYKGIQQVPPATQTVFPISGKNLWLLLIVVLAIVGYAVYRYYSR